MAHGPQHDSIINLAESRLAEDIGTAEAVYGQLLAGGNRVMPKMVLQEHPVSAQEGAFDPEARIDASAGEMTAGNTIITGGLGAVGSLIASWLFVQVSRLFVMQPRGNASPSVSFEPASKQGPNAISCKMVGWHFA